MFCSTNATYNLLCFFIYSCQLSTSSQSNQGGQNQSPIDIVTSQTTKGSKLKPLIFNAGWDQTVSGTVENTGYYLKFTADSTADKCTLKTYNGDYVLDQFHYHWGQCDGEGAEHYMDGKQYDIEFHFVHKKVGLTDPTAKDAFSVLGVFGKADSGAKMTGVWEKLSPLNVLRCGSKKNIGDVVQSNLLPKMKDYFHYEGSLTTPSYSEVVHWFVLKEPISVPSEYLEALRRMEKDDGKTICNNFRELQDVCSRTVERFETEH